jgi:hypothetical protein
MEQHFMVVEVQVGSVITDLHSCIFSFAHCIWNFLRNYNIGVGTKTTSPSKN